MLTPVLREDEENGSGDEEEEESTEKQGKSLALVTPPIKKAKIVKSTKITLRKVSKKIISKPLCPLGAQRERNMV